MNLQRLVCVKPYRHFDCSVKGKGFERVWFGTWLIDQND